MRRLMVVVLLGLVAAVVPVAAGAAPPEKVAICHYNADLDPDAPTWELLEVRGRDRTVDAHLDHGDAFPGDPVPGTDGQLVLDASCTPVLPDLGLDVCVYRDEQVQVGRFVSRPTELTVALGEQLTTATSTSQADGKYDVGPVIRDPGGPTVRVIVSDDPTPVITGSTYFSGSVDLGGRLVAIASAGGRSELPSNVYVHILSTTGTPLQTIKIHTSCSTPIVIGDQFGTASLVGVVLVETGTGERIVFGV